jgi:catecholate siderophore receptor
MGALVASTAFGGRLVHAAEPSHSQAATAPAAVSSQASQSHPFDIPAGSLAETLAAFEAATGVHLDTGQIPNDTLSMIQSRGARGMLTRDEALTALLEGTSLSFRATGPQSFAIQIQGAEEFVSVTGRTTRLESPKLTEPLRDIPQTITVIPASVIAQQNATTLRDVLRNVSGITFQAGEGGVPAGDQLTIRGFSARTDMFIDGVRDFGGYSRDSFNLEQVEVSKGPSSSLVGRGSTGGAINQVSKTPTMRTGDEVTIGAGNADYLRTSIDLNHPISALGSAAAFRLNAMFTNADVPERDEVGGERWGVAPSLAFGLGTGTRLALSYFHLRQDNVPEYGIPWVPANTNPELAAYSNGRPPVDRSNFYGLTSRDYEDTNTDVATAIVDKDFNRGLSLRNLTRWGRNKRDSVITAPRFASVNTSTAINRNLQSRDMEDDIVANMTNVTARVRTGPIGHAIATGVEISRETSENFGRTGPPAPTADLYHPNPSDPYSGPIVRNGASTRGAANSVAAYLFDTVDLASHWEITGGLRWDRFDVDSTAIAVDGAVTELGRTDNMVSWRSGAVYKPQPNGSIYVGVGTSFNPSAEGLSLTTATATVPPEKTVSYEVGAKWDVYDERVSLTGAVFRTEKTNARTPGVNPLDPPTVLDGEQRVQGVEVGVSGSLTRRWTAFASYSHMTSDIVASNTVGETGNALVLTPENTLSLWTTYTLPGNFVIGGGAQFMDNVFRNATNTAVVPSYWLVNGIASYEVNQFLTLRFNGNNLTNEDYVDRVGGGHFIPGPGRSISLSATLRR